MPEHDIESLLAALPAHRAQLFRARLDRWLPDLRVALGELYPNRDDVERRLIELAVRAFSDRSDTLHAHDLERSLAPDWFQRPDAIGYAAYADRFAGSLKDVGRRADYLMDLGVTYLHLMPLLEPRPGPNDGGYAVKDYRAVRQDLGTVADLRELTATLRERGISLCLDLVLNHVAREHEWAARARAGEAKYRDYFYVFPDRELPDRFESALPEVFPDFAPGNFTWDADLQGWVWTTFNDFQWDVNWSNPEVLCEYADIILDHANNGVEIFRLDAIAFTWKRMGTDSQNQPEVHALTQALRTLTRIACPATIFKAEAIVGPRDLPAYLGLDKHWGKVSDLAYHNVLMVQVWSMLACKDARLASIALRALPRTPPTTSWVAYLRCHDDIGWAIDDESAKRAGVTGAGHRTFLSDFYSGTFPGSWARGLVFQENPETRDRRISGSLTSLAGLEAGDPHAPQRIRLANALMLGFGGLPMIWMGDELGLLNDLSWDQVPQHAADNRWVHRPPMPEKLPADDHGINADLRALIAARTTLPQLHASVATEVMETRDPGVLMLVRRHPLGVMLGVYNVTDTTRFVPDDVLIAVGLDPETTHDHISGQRLARPESASELAPYQPAWLV